MLDGLTPDLVPRLVLAIGGVGIAFVVLILVLIFLKRRNSPLFIKGGKAREPRLLVLDAAAVDPKRRLVLIRRDDVEHLIMIGGPTDIVIETGIGDRGKSATTAVGVSVDDTAPRPIAVPAQVERRPEVACTVQAAQGDREMRPTAAAAAQPASRPIPPSAAAQERVARAIDRPVERPTIERVPEPSQTVSAMGSVLYSEDREPMTGAKPTPSSLDPRLGAPAAVAQQQPSSQPANRPVQPAPSAAEAALDAARDRVLPNAQPSGVGAPPVTVADAERALAARMDTMRRVQSAQPGVSSAAVPTPQAVVPPAEQKLDAPRARDGEQSDFEKLLEAELDANGVFEKHAPEVRSEARVNTAVAASPAAPPVRVSPPITGASPDITSEEEVARLLGEIAINRKP
jgi:hypothetical protein